MHKLPVDQGGNSFRICQASLVWLSNQSQEAQSKIALKSLGYNWFTFKFEVMGSLAEKTEEDLWKTQCAGNFKLQVFPKFTLIETNHAKVSAVRDLLIP